MVKHLFGVGLGRIAGCFTRYLYTTLRVGLFTVCLGFIMGWFRRLGFIH